jgi:primase-polymerase (primpol)-like protein
MYTVLNIPKENFDEVYSIRKGDIDAIAQSFIKEYTNGLSEYLNSKMV